MKKMSIVLLCLFSLFVCMEFASADIVGFWEFDDAGDLTLPSVGLPLTLVGSHSAMDGFEEGDGAVNIGVGSHYICEHGIAPNGGRKLCQCMVASGRFQISRFRMALFLSDQYGQL